MELRLRVTCLTALENAKPFSEAALPVGASNGNTRVFTLQEERVCFSRTAQTRSARPATWERCAARSCCLLHIEPHLQMRVLSLCSVPAGANFPNSLQIRRILHVVTNVHMFPCDTANKNLFGSKNVLWPRL